MMKTAFIIFVVLHGLIHLLGFLKAFDLAEVKELKMPITRPFGIIWLLTSILFLVTAFLFHISSGMYIRLGVTAVILSQTLIWRGWEDARYGSIPNLIIAVILFLSF